MVLDAVIDGKPICGNQEKLEETRKKAWEYVKRGASRGQKADGCPPRPPSRPATDAEMLRVWGVAAGLGLREGLERGVFRHIPVLTPSVRKPQKTVDLSKMEEITQFRGRYDVSVVPKALVALEVMTAVTLADHALRAGLIRRDKPLA